MSSHQLRWDNPNTSKRSARNEPSPPGTHAELSEGRVHFSRHDPPDSEINFTGRRGYSNLGREQSRFSHRPHPYRGNNQKNWNQNQRFNNHSGCQNNHRFKWKEQHTNHYQPRHHGTGSNYKNQSHGDASHEPYWNRNQSQNATHQQTHTIQMGDIDLNPSEYHSYSYRNPYAGHNYVHTPPPPPIISEELLHTGHLLSNQECGPSMYDTQTEHSAGDCLIESILSAQNTDGDFEDIVDVTPANPVVDLTDIQYPYTPSENPRSPVCITDSSDTNTEENTSSKRINTEQVTKKLINKVARMDKHNLKELINNPNRKYATALESEARRKYREEMREQRRIIGCQNATDTSLEPDECIDSSSIPTAIFDEISRVLKVDMTMDFNDCSRSTSSDDRFSNFLEVCSNSVQLSDSTNTSNNWFQTSAETSPCRRSQIENLDTKDTADLRENKKRISHYTNRQKSNPTFNDFTIPSSPSTSRLQTEIKPSIVSQSMLSDDESADQPALETPIGSPTGSLNNRQRQDKTPPRIESLDSLSLSPDTPNCHKTEVVQTKKQIKQSKFDMLSLKAQIRIFFYAPKKMLSFFLANPGRETRMKFLHKLNKKQRKQLLSGRIKEIPKSILQEMRQIELERNPIPIKRKFASTNDNIIFSREHDIDLTKMIESTSTSIDTNTELKFARDIRKLDHVDESTANNQHELEELACLESIEEIPPSKDNVFVLNLPTNEENTNTIENPSQSSSMESSEKTDFGNTIPESVNVLPVIPSGSDGDLTSLQVKSMNSSSQPTVDFIETTDGRIGHRSSSKTELRRTLKNVPKQILSAISKRLKELNSETSCSASAPVFSNEEADSSEEVIDVTPAIPSFDLTDECFDKPTIGPGESAIARPSSPIPTDEPNHSNPPEAQTENDVDKEPLIQTPSNVSTTRRKSRSEDNNRICQVGEITTIYPEQPSRFETLAPLQSVEKNRDKSNTPTRHMNTPTLSEQIQRNMNNIQSKSKLPLDSCSNNEVISALNVVENKAINTKTPGPGREANGSSQSKVRGEKSAEKKRETKPRAREKNTHKQSNYIKNCDTSKQSPSGHKKRDRSKTPILNPNREKIGTSNQTDLNRSNPSDMKSAKPTSVADPKSTSSKKRKISTNSEVIKIQNNKTGSKALTRDRNMIQPSKPNSQLRLWRSPGEKKCIEMSASGTEIRKQSSLSKVQENTGLNPIKYKYTSHEAVLQEMKDIDDEIIENQRKRSQIDEIIFRHQREKDAVENSMLLLHSRRTLLLNMLLAAPKGCDNEKAARQYVSKKWGLEEEAPQKIVHPKPIDQPSTSMAKKRAKGRIVDLDTSAGKASNCVKDPVLSVPLSEGRDAAMNALLAVFNKRSSEEETKHKMINRNTKSKQSRAKMTTKRRIVEFESSDDEAPNCSRDTLLDEPSLEENNEMNSLLVVLNKRSSEGKTRKQIAKRKPKRKRITSGSKSIAKRPVIQLSSKDDAHHDVQLTNLDDPEFRYFFTNPCRIVLIPIRYDPATENVIVCNSETSEDAVKPFDGRYIGHRLAIVFLQIVDQFLIAASEDGNIYQFCLASGCLISTFIGHTKLVTGFVCTTNNKMFSVSLDGFMRIVHLADFSKQVKAVDVGEPLQVIEHNSDKLFIGSKSGKIYLYREYTNTLDPHCLCDLGNSILAMRLGKEGPRSVLIIAATTNDLNVRDAYNGLLLRTIHVGSSNVYSILLDSGVVHCGTNTNQLLSYEFASGDQVSSHTVGNGTICIRQYGPHVLLCGSYDSNIYAIDKKTGAHICRIPGPGKMLLHFDILNDEIIVATKDGRHLQLLTLPDSVLKYENANVFKSP